MTGETKVANRRRVPPDGVRAVYIGRRGHGHDGDFGNPFPRATPACLARFRAYFLSRVARDPAFRARALALRGKTLVCGCAPRPCHGDVIAAWVDAQPLPPHDGHHFTQTVCGGAPTLEPDDRLV